MEEMLSDERYEKDEDKKLDKEKYSYMIFYTSDDNFKIQMQLEKANIQLKGVLDTGSPISNIIANLYKIIQFNLRKLNYTMHPVNL